jgi:4-amino-4-deoxy-L-arabinose transferase-like glycosyltransferase
MTPKRAVLLSMLFFLICCIVWVMRVPVVNGEPVSFNSDEPSHFRVIRYISEHWSLPPYTRDYYESAHPPLPYVFQAAYSRLWPEDVRVYSLRFLSTLFGLLTILVIYKTSRQLANAWTSATTACLVATLPMFIMFSSSVTNDAIAVLLSSVTIYLIVRCFREGLSLRSLSAMCILVGAAGITKYTLLGLVPIAMAAVIYDRRRTGRSWIVPILCIAVSFVLISGWWYVRNQIVYGDPFRTRAEAEMGMFTGGAAPASPRYWWSVMTTMSGSFLGIYPSFPKWPSTVYGTVTAIFSAVVAAASYVGAIRNWKPLKFALISFAALTFLVVMAYQIDHFQPHGRLLFSAISVIAMGLAGVRHVIPVEKRALVGVASIVMLALLSLALVTSPI